jgi:hypothetical protein
MSYFLISHNWAPQCHSLLEGARFLVESPKRWLESSLAATKGVALRDTVYVVGTFGLTPSSSFVRKC